MTGDDAVVNSVSTASAHQFSKRVVAEIRLVVGHGIEGDAHAGPFVRHRFLARYRPQLPNERQVHLIEAELFDELSVQGFDVGPGQLGENVTTRGLMLRRLPLGTRLRLGSDAIVELRGLRTPCVLVDRFQKGLLQALVQKGETPRFRAGVMATVVAGGTVHPGDRVRTVLPADPHHPLPPL
jgi:MOSC domain-containing protein